jgi:tetratricopeptide (TPR) repeat protein
MEQPDQAGGSPPARESRGLLGSLYRLSFWGSLAAVGLSIAAGFAASWRAGQLPGLKLDALVQARRFEAAGDLPRAFEQYRKAAILQSGVAAYSSIVAEAFLRHRRLKEADSWFRAANRIDPAMAGAYAGLGEIALEEDRLDDAAQLFAQALKLDPRNAGFHNELGIAHALRGRYPEAIAAFGAALQLGAGPQTRDNLERARRDAARAGSVT